MKYIVIEAPTLTDEAAVSLQDFFYTITEAFAEHYFNQTERYHMESVVGTMADVDREMTEGNPPF